MAILIKGHLYLLNTCVEVSGNLHFNYASFALLELTVFQYFVLRLFPMCLSHSQLVGEYRDQTCLFMH